MFRYTPRQIPNNILVIGAGGTGSRLIPLLSQFLRSITRDHSPNGWLTNPNIFLVDDDVIEAKNLMRQNFIESDIGKHKATVLAQRYSRAYGINIFPVLTRVEANISVNELLGETSFNPDSGLMTIMCVDSSNARRSILAMLGRFRVQDSSLSTFVIDAGNENNFGQVSFFNMATWLGDPDKCVAPLKNSPVVIDIPFIPYPYKFYQDLVDAPSQGSCADLDQTLAINALMATNIMGVVQNFYYVKPFMHNGVSISLDGASCTTFNTGYEFKSRLTNYTNNHGYADGVGTIKQFNRETEKAMAKMQKDVEDARRKEQDEIHRKKMAEIAKEKGKTPELTAVPRKRKSASADAEGGPYGDDLETVAPVVMPNPREVPPLVQIR